MIDSNLQYKASSYLKCISNSAHFPLRLFVAQQIVQGIAFRCFIVKHGSKGAPRFWKKKNDI